MLTGAKKEPNQKTKPLMEKPGYLLMYIPIADQTARYPSALCSILTTLTVFNRILVVLFQTNQYSFP